MFWAESWSAFRTVQAGINWARPSIVTSINTSSTSLAKSNYFAPLNPPNRTTAGFQIARKNFIKSLAAYSLVSYILQIKDRHNGNILIDNEGHVAHIDFGFIFDWSPGRDMRFESANFKLTSEMIKVLGGDEKSEAYNLFVNLTIKGFLAIREYFDVIIATIYPMFHSGQPCFKVWSMDVLN